MDTPPTALFRLDPALVKRLPLDEAVALETATPPDLLPSGLVEHAIARLSGEFVAHLTGLVRKGLGVAVPDVVAARKARGTRPVPVLAFSERVLLRAMGLLLKSQLPSDIPGGIGYEEMVSGPLDASAAWVVHADVAGFYSFVDHDLLESELVALTGDSTTASGLVDLLGRLMGRRFGLPQGHRSSDLFADVYIDYVERQLIRLGRNVWRYSDDFRIMADSRADADRCIEQLDEQLRRVGLVLNDDKTFSQSGEHYRRWVSAAEEQIGLLAEEVHADLTDWNPYTDEPIEPQDEDVWSQAATQALLRWVETPEEQRFGAWRLASRRVVTTALTILRTYQRADAVPFCFAILSVEPQLTPHVAGYLRALGQDALPALSGILQEPNLYLNAWQRLWLLDAARATPNLPPDVLAWIQRCIEPDAPSVLRASAASLLSRFGLVTPQELVALHGELPLASRPEVAAARVRLGGLTKAEMRSLRDDFVSKAVVDDIRDQIEPQPF